MIFFINPFNELVNNMARLQIDLSYNVSFCDQYSTLVIVINAVSNICSTLQSYSLRPRPPLADRTVCRTDVKVLSTVICQSMHTLELLTLVLRTTCCGKAIHSQKESSFHHHSHRALPVTGTYSNKARPHLASNIRQIF